MSRERGHRAAWIKVAVLSSRGLIFRDDPGDRWNVRASTHPSMAPPRNASGRPASDRRAAEDPDLIRRCQEGEERAFAELYRTCRQDVVRILHRVVGPSDDLDDLVQNAFIEVFRTVHRFRGESRFSTWLYRVCIHIGLRHLRGRRRQRDTATESAVLDARPAETGDPHRQLEAQQALARVRAALETLTEKKRVVFVLFEMEGFSLREVADMVDIPIPTVKSRLFHARREFFAELARLGGGDATQGGAA
jgi:RNA polymerase sigma-70 factor (ECF subfamily)